MSLEEAIARIAKVRFKYLKKCENNQAAETAWRRGGK